MIGLVKTSGPPTEKERREWLKKEHKLGTNSAWWMAERAEGKGWRKTRRKRILRRPRVGGGHVLRPARTLRPLYDHLLKPALSLGKDVKACPGKTIVALYRNHVFAQIKPSTNTRIDLGLALGNMKIPKWLIDTGGYEKKDRITRRIEVKSKADIDDELKHWLTRA